MLGLGTQVKAHIERRFGMPWPESVTGKLREQILAVRALWECWQHGTKLNFRGEHYKLTLMSPFFNPGPIEHPAIPIYIAGVNAGLARLAGELCDGFVVHPFHSPRYLKEVILPAVAAGLDKAVRKRREISLAVTAFLATGAEEQRNSRSQLAFYASTPSYRPVMALHGWGATADKLSSLASRGEWDAMPALLSDAQGVLPRCGRGRSGASLEGTLCWPRRSDLDLHSVRTGRERRVLEAARRLVWIAGAREDSMGILDWIVAAFVIVTLVYVSFALTLRDWLVALQKGEAVTLLPERTGHKWPLWTQVALMVVALAICVPFFYYLWIPLFALPGLTAGILKIAGLILYVLGLAVVLWARRTLGKNWGISTSAQVKLLTEHELVQGGPYAYVRHPMYSGWWVCMLGLVSLYPVWAVFLLFVFSLISFFNRARREEAALAARFGEAWIAYKQRTKRLIPSVY